MSTLARSYFSESSGTQHRSVKQWPIVDAIAFPTSVDDGYEPPPPRRALGYNREGGGYVKSDYHVATINGHELDFRSSTIGSGGMYSTVDDLYALDRALVSGLVARLERRMTFALSINEGELYLSIGDGTLTGLVRRCTLE